MVSIAISASSSDVFEAHADLLRHLRERPGQPLTTWTIPDSWGEARITVVRQ